MVTGKKKAKSEEAVAMEAICADCDEIDGYGFTRPAHMMAALLDVYDDGRMAGRQVAKLMESGLIEVDLMDDTVWVEPEVYARYI